VEEQRNSHKQASRRLPREDEEDERLRIIKEYVDSLREIMKKLRYKLN
jgi:hypothetical protein